MNNKTLFRITHLSTSFRYFTATWLNAALIPAATDSVLPTAQKCMKNRRGCSVSMWLCSAVTCYVVFFECGDHRIDFLRRQHEIPGCRNFAGAGFLEVDCLGYALRAWSVSFRDR